MGRRHRICGGRHQERCRRRGRRRQREAEEALRGPARPLHGHPRILGTIEGPLPVRLGHPQREGGLRPGRAPGTQDLSDALGALPGETRPGARHSLPAPYDPAGPRGHVQALPLAEPLHAPGRAPGRPHAHRRARPREEGPHIAPHTYGGRPGQDRSIGPVGRTESPPNGRMQSVVWLSRSPPGDSSASPTK